MKKQLVFLTGNMNKLKEVQDILIDMVLVHILL